MKKLLFAVKLYTLAVLDYAFCRLTYAMAKQGMILGANTLTGLIPTLYASLDIVSRELVGMIPAVSRDSNAERAALNETITIPIVPANAAVDVTPAVTAPDNGDAVVGNATMTISKSRMVPVRVNGEEMRGLANAGTGQSIMAQRFAQAFRTLTNEIESDLAGLYAAASRAYGTPATAPFGTANDLSDLAQAIKILEDNGAPSSDMQAVLGSSAIANMRGKQSGLFKVNEAGTDQLLRQGILGRLENCDIHNSSGIKTPTKGTGASYTSNTAGYAVGATDITLITGTGTVLAGDSVTFAGDTNKYVVKTGVAAPGVLVLQEPGLKVALAASAIALTVGATATQNMVFSRSAIQLITRAPAMPEGGDMADDILDIADPISGLSFQIAVYRQYRQVKYEVAMAWGQKMVAPRHAMNLLG